MAKTQIDYAKGIKNLPVIDVRAYMTDAQAAGTADATAAIQSALDAAGVGTTTPCIVQIPRGIFICTTALKFNRDGIVLQGFGMMGVGTSDNNCSVLRADDGVGAHDNTPMLQMDPADISRNNWYRGCCIRDVSFDVSRSARFTTGTPPPILKLRSLSNTPDFQNVLGFGSIGTFIDLGTSVSVPSALSEGVSFVNCYSYGGYTASGGNSGISPVAPAVVLTACGEVRFCGGKYAYPFPPTAAGNSTDVPAILIQSSGVANFEHGGWIAFDGVSTTQYNIHYSMVGSEFSSQHYGPHNVWWSHCDMENYNRGMVLRTEAASGGHTNTPSISISVPRNNRFLNGYTSGGHSPIKVQADWLQNGAFEFDDIDTFPSTFGANTNDLRIVGGLVSNQQITNNGKNLVFYTYNFLSAEILGHELRIVGPAGNPNGVPSPSSTRSLFCRGSVQQLWDTSRSPSGTAGVQYEMCFDASTGKLWMCSVTGNPGTWISVQFA